MRTVSIALTGLLALAVVAPAAAQAPLSEAVRRCADSAESPDMRSDGCTRAIDSGQYSGRTLSALYANRAAIHRRAGELERAEEDVAYALAHNPANDIALTVRGNIYSNRRNFEQAIADYDQAIKINALRWDAYTGRALANYAIGNYDLAIRDWTRLIAKAPSANSYTDRANAHFMLGQFDRALADYDQALKLDRNHPDAAKYRAETLKKLGR